MEHFSLWPYLDFFPSITKYIELQNFCITTHQHVIVFFHNFLFNNFTFTRFLGTRFLNSKSTLEQPILIAV